MARRARSSGAGSSPHVRGTRYYGRAYLSAGRFIPACAGNTLLPPEKATVCTVHPRMCGEHDLIDKYASRIDGSSPHVRGTPFLRGASLIYGRFIPACAGNTSKDLQGAAGCAVHPRMCGEHETGEGMPNSNSGSSPHVRGTQSVRTRNTLRLRFIPACAGNTIFIVSVASVRSVHPRMCGEHLAILLPLTPTNGSSPHVRGTRPFLEISTPQQRFIPACAGNTVLKKSDGLCAAVHPRMCGEHLDSGNSKIWQTGSSPHVRGTRISSHVIRVQKRFIPACAGNTSARPRVSVSCSVHPRMCGEHCSHSRKARSDSGSSPHVRGTLAKTNFSAVKLRFIPACAGNTTNTRLPRLRVSVHPRMCGEHRIMAAQNAPDNGSSPHVRGTHLEFDRGRSGGRFIPACAGNTSVNRRLFS